MSFYPLKLYFKNLPNLILLPLSLFLNIFVWVWLLWKIRPQVDPIFLHYNILFGVDYIGEWWRILFLPLTGLIILLLNAIIGWLMFRQEKFVAYLLNSITLICQIFLLLTSYFLIYLNV